MASCLLFHGPGAHQVARSKALSMGHITGEFGQPQSDEGLGGLKVDEAREAMSLLYSTPLYNTIGCVLIGPVDEANPKASDVLLKGIEEFASDVVQPILWAHDYGSVTATVRSRCMETWCPGSSSDENDELIATAWVLVDNALSKDLHLIPPDVLKYKKSKEVPQMIQAISDALSTDLADPKRLVLWGRVRQVALFRNPTPTELIAALLGA